MRLKTLALCILAVAATASAAIDPVLLNLVMPDAKILSGMNVAQSVASPFGQYVLSQMQPGDPGFQKFILSTGVDPTRDVHEVLAATNSDGTTSPTSFLALARGTYVPAQILAAATANGGTITQYRGFSIIADPAADASTAIVFLDATTAVAGDLASVKSAIDRKLAGATYTGTLAQKAQAASASNSAWFATVTPLSVFSGWQTGRHQLERSGAEQSAAGRDASVGRSEFRIGHDHADHRRGGRFRSERAGVGRCAEVSGEPGSHERSESSVTGKPGDVQRSRIDGAHQHDRSGETGGAVVHAECNARFENQEGRGRSLIPTARYASINAPSAGVNCGTMTRLPSCSSTRVRKRSSSIAL